jgi:uncharacterized membrane protein
MNSIKKITKGEIEPASHSTTRKLAMAALFLALIYVTTAFIKIPMPTVAGGGYLNLGDSFVALAALLIASPLAAFAAGVGSALADLTIGYGPYALPTFFIKACMALIIVYLVRRGSFPLFVLGVLLAEIFMVAGYFAFEYFAVNPIVALASAPFNAIQGGVNLALALLLFRPITQLREVINDLQEVESGIDVSKLQRKKKD